MERRFPPLECLGLEVRKSEAKQSETMDQRPETEDLRPETMNQRVETGDQRSETMDQGPGTPGCHRAENAEQRPACSDSRVAT